MLRMNQIDQIKELQRQGLGPQEIAGRLIRHGRGLILRLAASLEKYSVLVELRRRVADFR